MKNSELPAYPPNAGWEHSEAKGLTKLEMFTMAAMQGLCVNYKKHGDCVNYNWPHVAEKALAVAEATLAALESRKDG